MSIPTRETPEDPEAAQDTSARQNPGEAQPAREMTMEEALEAFSDFSRPQRGDILDGIVIHKDAYEILVDIGGKTEAIVPYEDLSKLGEESLNDIQVGDEVSVYVMNPSTPDGELLVSLNMAKSLQDWKRAKELEENGEPVDVEVVGFNKGGLVVQFGQLQGFIPRSHVASLPPQRPDSGQGDDRLGTLVGETLTVKVIEVNRRQRRLVMSERNAARVARASQKERLLTDLNEGDIVRGRVSNLTDFGAFVDLGGADGLIHVSELSWDRVRHPRDVLKVGEEIEAHVLRVDQERRRIGLSLKRMRPDPWTEIEKRYVVGEVVQARITNLTDFGAFAWLEEGIEGLIHISELSDTPIQHPREVVHRGQLVNVEVVSIDLERQRIGLSLRRATQAATEAETTEGEATEAEAVEGEATAVGAEPMVEGEENRVEERENESATSQISLPSSQVDA
ncbi:MAG: S1 RNA-binding domain-containing protein [Chloroflexi bacterium]|nr:S1 RNA-binding domain-containing protein [Chloroflexota bacterium]